MEVMQNNMVVAILGKDPNHTFLITDLNGSVAVWPYDFCFTIAGKGDLVGCDISQHLLNCSGGQGGGSQHGTSSSQDVIVKSSSDVKVMSLINADLRTTALHSIKLYVTEYCLFRHSRTAI